jgi:hypothetical protein
VISTDTLEALQNLAQLAYERGASREELLGYINEACDDVDRVRAEAAESGGGRG